MYMVEMGYGCRFVVDKQGLDALLVFLDRAEYVDNAKGPSGHYSQIIAPIPANLPNICPYPEYTELKLAQVLNISLAEYKESIADDTNPVSE